MESLEVSNRDWTAHEIEKIAKNHRAKFPLKSEEYYALKNTKTDDGILKGRTFDNWFELLEKYLRMEIQIHRDPDLHELEKYQTDLRLKLEKIKDENSVRYSDHPEYVLTNAKHKLVSNILVECGKEQKISSKDKKGWKEEMKEKIGSPVMRGVNSIWADIKNSIGKTLGITSWQKKTKNGELESVENTNEDSRNPQTIANTIRKAIFGKRALNQNSSLHKSTDFSQSNVRDIRSAQKGLAASKGKSRKTGPHKSPSVSSSSSDYRKAA